MHHIHFLPIYLLQSPLHYAVSNLCFQIRHSSILFQKRKVILQYHIAGTAVFPMWYCGTTYV